MAPATSLTIVTREFTELYYGCIGNDMTVNDDGMEIYVCHSQKLISCC